MIIYEVAFTLLVSAILSLALWDWSPLILGICLSCFWCLVARNSK
ncbi:hypothetical protein phiOC_p083 [Ochrobactrum phage vB_OspM_OC]|nr:hypothetical protein phiOC_p083 [Ochrobactrum phage vB_OspM_OC]